MPYTVKLLDKKEIAEGTMAFTFEKPEGYSFKPGQATDWNLIDPKETDSRSPVHLKTPSSDLQRA